MSAIATTTEVPISALAALRDAAVPRKHLIGGPEDRFPLALARHGRALELFEHSGDLLATVLAYLDEKHGIDLMHSRHEEVASAITKARGSRFVILGEEVELGVAFGARIDAVDVQHAIDVDQQDRAPCIH